MKKKQRNKKPRIAARFIAAVLIAALSVNGYYVYNIFGGEVADATNYKGMNDEQIALQQEREVRKQAREEAEYLSYTPDSFNDINTVIVDENDAETLFSELRYEMNLFDISDTFSFAYSRSNEYFDVYTMQQYHDGIEVYGREIKMTIDKSGNLLSVDGNPADLNGFDTTVTLNEDDAYTYVEKYLKSEYQLTSEEVSIESCGKKIIFDDNDEPVTGYLFDYIFNNSSEPYGCIFFNGNTGVVVNDSNYVSLDMIETDLEGQQGNQTLYIYNDGEKYKLIDQDRGIIVAKGSNAKGGEVIAWDYDKRCPNKSGVDVLANLQRIYDFYLDTFNRVGIHDNMEQPLTVFVDAGDINLWSNAQMYESGNTLEIGTNFFMSTKAAYLDVIAHEYGHGVVFSESGISATESEYSQSAAINEGMADILGELAEDYCDDSELNGTCNWIHGTDRNIANPSDKNNENMILETKAVYNATDWENDECHNASYITSYSAYLMTQGINGTQPLTNEELAKLYYNSLNKLSAGCTFKEFRKKIEETALAMNQNMNQIGPLTVVKSDSVKKSGKLTDSQWESIIDSFDRVGIERSYDHSLVKNAEIQVIDVNNKPYDNYHLKITRKNDGAVVVDKDVKKKKYTLPNLDKGVYEFELIDLDNEKDIVKVDIIINDNAKGQLTENYKDKDNILTTFGSLNKEVALVLDVSGSMEGEPMTQTKQAALNFVETVFEANPNINVTLITYSDTANLLLESCNNEALLCGTIMGLRADGGTEMVGAISTAESVLNDRDVEDKYVIVMSDGNPSDSPVLAANSIKENDIILCSLGFYHSSDEGASLMKDIASPGYYYNVQNAADIQGVFDEIARQVSGEKYSIRRIACPVDVIVSYNGETLCSAEENQNLRTSFGSISFEGENNEVKILRLDDKADYEVCIYGTGKGTMDYTVSYVDKNGEYTDVRNFERVPINRKTVIVSNAVEDTESILRIDSDGDGRFDLTYTASEGKDSETADNRTWMMALVISGVILTLWLILEIILLIRRIKKDHVCAGCKNKTIQRDSKFCIECGKPVNNLPIFPKLTKPVGKQKIICRIQTVLVMFCVVMTVATTVIYSSAANTVFLQLRNSELASAEIMYENGVEENTLACAYLSVITDVYLKRVEQAYTDTKISSDEAKTIYQAVAEMEMGKASDSAKTKLESLFDENKS